MSDDLATARIMRTIKSSSNKIQIEFPTYYNNRPLFTESGGSLRSIDPDYVRIIYHLPITEDPKQNQVASEKVESTEVVDNTEVSEQFLINYDTGENR